MIMETMTLTLNLPEDVTVALKDKAKISGKGVVEYVETMISTQVRRPSFDEILAPVRKGFAQTHESEEEILAFFEEIREEVCLEKQLNAR